MAVKAPQYSGACVCRKPGGHTLVIHVWPQKLHQAFRSKLNSTKFYPEVETCEQHAPGLQEIGKDFMWTRWLQAVDFCKGMGRGEPDINDVLFEAVKTDEALKMWADTKIDPAAENESGRMVAVKDINPQDVINETLH